MRCQRWERPKNVEQTETVEPGPARLYREEARDPRLTRALTTRPARNW